MISRWVQPFAEQAAGALEIFGVAIIVLMGVVATVDAARRVVQKSGWHDVFHAYRLELSRGILLGLEFLVAADIIHTVAVDLTYASVGVLVIVVLVRTFLSFTIEVEITGRWPWEKGSR